MSNNIHVFHGLVNYGTQAGVIANELRNQGIDALSVAWSDRYKRKIDVTLTSDDKCLLSSIYWQIANIIFCLRCFFKFNIFHFYYGTTLAPRQYDLPFYRIFNKKVIFHYLGLDLQSYQKSIDKYEFTNVRYVFDETTGVLHDRKIEKRVLNETKYADLQLVCAPYLSEFLQKTEVIPLAIDINEYQYFPKNNIEKEVTVMHAPTRRDNKGTRYILDAIQLLISEGYSISLLLVENVSHEELKEKYKECDIFIDQIVSGWYGTAAIEAMAIGRPTVCFIRESYFQYINYGENIPIISATPQTIYQVLKELINNRQQLATIGAASRKFVEDIHDSKAITKKLINIYANMNSCVEH